MRSSSVSIVLCALAILGLHLAPVRAQDADDAGVDAPPSAQQEAESGGSEADPSSVPAAEAPTAGGEPADDAEPAFEEPALGDEPPAAGTQAEPGGSTALPVPAVADPEAAAAAPPLESGGLDADVPSPGEMQQRLSEGLEEFDGVDTWTEPVPVFALDGYMRMRGELMDTFWLGRTPHDEITPNDTRDDAGLGPDPFSRYRPVERRAAGLGSSSCSGDSDRCDVDTLQNANLRLRLSPQINLTEDVRVRATFDVLDNIVAGQAPQSFYGSGYPATFSDTLLPTGGRGADTDPGGTGFLGSSIVARRAWAEVRNRDLGELRFGRMPHHWGLGMRYNAGNGLDHDFSTEFDRVQALTKFAGFYFTAAYDFVAEGSVAQQFFGDGFDRPYYDGSQIDDVDQFSFSVSHQLSEEEAAAQLRSGEVVLNGGAHFELRMQDSIYGGSTLADDGTTQYEFRPISLSRYVPDLWGQLLFPGGRIEAELAWALGSLRDADGNDQSINQLGLALETEFRFVEDKLGLYLYGGLATGDDDVEGLSPDANFVDRAGGGANSRVSTYSFHPSYQVDMILWRNIMRQVSGAYYLKPGVSYDFVRTDFGELFGLRLDVIWSRASRPIQAPGNDPNLGVEFNAQLYWRSEDGAELDDGYHASLQYGALFPLAGLGFAESDSSYYDGDDLKVAQQLRLLLGVKF